MRVARHESGASGFSAVALLLALGGAPWAQAAEPAKVDFRSLYEAATTIYKAGSYVEALSTYEKAYALEPRPEALYGIARCHDQLGHLDAADASYTKFLASATTHEGAPRARAYLVLVLERVGYGHLATADHVGARAAFERALALVPDLSEDGGEVSVGSLRAGLGEALSALGERDAAVAELRLALSPPPAAAVRARAVSLLAKLEAEAKLPATAPAPPALGPVTPAPAPAARKGRSPWPWVAVGGAAAIVASGVAVVLVLLLPGPAERLRLTLRDEWVFDFRP